MASYQCPYCDHHQAITSPKLHSSSHEIELQDNAEGKLAVSLHALSCANPKCRKTAVRVILGDLISDRYGMPHVSAKGTLYFNARILPAGAAKVFPDYIPAALLEDYREACLIKDLSPKAAATLVRRCLQGMIRDFCGITKGRLVDEISELKERLAAEKAPQGVSHETVEAIDHVRGIGNIGAHMERDIGLIIPVEPDEADALIGLVELLFEEWYVARQRRTDRLEVIKGVAAEKAAIKAAGGKTEPKAFDEA